MRRFLKAIGTSRRQLLKKIGLYYFDRDAMYYNGIEKKWPSRISVPSNTRCINYGCGSHNPILGLLDHWHTDRYGQKDQMDYKALDGQTLACKLRRILRAEWKEWNPDLELQFHGLDGPRNLQKNLAGDTFDKFDYREDTSPNAEWHIGPTFEVTGATQTWEMHFEPIEIKDDESYPSRFIDLQLMGVCLWFEKK